MAEAGSVAPVFRDGGYDETTIYDFYHALIHNNKLYFCRQDGTIGHEPQAVSDEYWFLSLDGNFADAASLGGETAEQWQEKITNLTNGTTPAGDSEKLGGKGAGEYALLANLVLSLLGEKVKYRAQDTVNCNDLTHAVVLGRASSSTYNFPAIGGWWYIVTMAYSASMKVQIGISQDANTIVVRQLNGETWSKWSDPFATTADLANYFKSTGGIVNGNVRQVVEGATQVDHRLTNSVRNIAIILQDNGVFKIHDYTNAQTLMQFLADGTNTFNGVATGCLPLDGGGTVKGASYAPIAVKNTVSGAATTKYETSSEIVGYLGINDAGNPIFMDSSKSHKELLHTGNSAKTIQSATAPSDTTAIWIDTSNNKVKAYKDGAWTIMA